ncbi:MAG: DUF2961 domain-containing protein, partial [Bacteroidota bacterium]
QGSYGKSWWGEGDVKIFLDGDPLFPTLNGTGTEDYIGTGWMLGQYANLYQGCLVANYERMRYCFYRYHIPDPVYFHSDIRVTIQQIGILLPHNVEELQNSRRPIYKAGEGLTAMDPNQLEPFQLFEREDDWSSCCYFYLDKTENHLSPLISLEERLKDL